MFEAYIVWIPLLIIFVFSSLTIVFYYKKDKYEPEPPKRIIFAFLLGVISIIPSLILSVIMLFIISDEVLASVIIAPIAEEIGKIMFVIWLSKNESFDGPLDGFIYGAMVGVGFSVAENLLYAGQFFLNYNIGVVITLTTFRSLSQIIGHPLYTGLSGIGVGEFKVGISTNKYSQLWRAMLMHAIWNASSSLGGVYTALGLIIVVIASILIMRYELNIVTELDKRAYETGYYQRKIENQRMREEKFRQQIYGNSNNLTNISINNINNTIPSEFNSNISEESNLIDKPSSLKDENYNNDENDNL